MLVLAFEKSIREPVLDDVEIRGIQVDALGLGVLLHVDIAVCNDGTCKLQQRGAADQVVDGDVRDRSISLILITELDGDTVAQSLAGLWVLHKASEVGQSRRVLLPLIVCAEEVAAIGVMDLSAVDRHPAELDLGAVEGKDDDTHHVWAWGVACILEGAAEQLVNGPVSLLAVTATVVDVLAAGAEFSRLGTDGTLAFSGSHDDSRCW